MLTDQVWESKSFWTDFLRCWMLWFFFQTILTNTVSYDDSLAIEVSFQILSMDMDSKTESQDLLHSYSTSFLHFNKHGPVWGLEKERSARTYKQLGQTEKEVALKSPLHGSRRRSHMHPPRTIFLPLCAYWYQFLLWPFVFRMYDGYMLMPKPHNCYYFVTFQLPLTLLHSQAYNALYLYSLYLLPLLWDSFLH